MLYQNLAYLYVLPDEIQSSHISLFFFSIKSFDLL